MLTVIFRLWCRFAHPASALLRPFNGKYVCSVCLSEHEAPYR
jgi:hypothetical protein